MAVTGIKAIAEFVLPWKTVKAFTEGCLQRSLHADFTCLQIHRDAFAVV